MTSTIEVQCYICGSSEGLQKCQYCGNLACTKHRVTFIEADIVICHGCFKEPVWEDEEGNIA